MTPTREATSSPKDRVIASPGISSLFSQTRRGPIGFLSGSRKESMRPPLVIIRVASSFWLGFWSRLMAWATILPSLPYFTMMPRESPTLTQKSFYPRVMMLTQVEPEKRMSIMPLNSSSLQFRKALLKAMQISSVFRASLFCYFRR